MKKTMFLMVLFLLFGNYLFSQTWTERADGDGFVADFEWKVITREEWNRLVRQQEVKYQYAILDFIDVLESSSSSSNSRVISGRKPTFQGYHFLMVTIKPRNDNTRNVLSMYGNYMRLIYGNVRTGRFTLAFNNAYQGYSVGSDSYTRRYNQCIGWVNGEQ